MDDSLIAFIVMGSLVSGIVLIVKTMTDHFLKRKLINARADAALAAQLLGSNKRTTAYSALKWGLVIGSLGGALILLQFLPFQPTDPLVYGVMFVSAGLGLVGYYLLVGVLQRHQEDEPRDLYDERDLP